MKLTKEIFKELEAEKKKADTHAMHVDLAIQSLQNICKHEYESDSLAGQYEQPCCKVCGFEFTVSRNESNRLETIVFDDLDSQMVNKFEFLLKDKSYKFNFGQSPRGVSFEGRRPLLLGIKYQNLRLNKLGLSKYIDFLTELHTAME